MWQYVKFQNGTFLIVLVSTVSAFTEPADTKSSPMILSPNSPGVILSEADCMTEATCPAFRTGRVKLCITPTQGAEMWANVLSYL